MKLQDIPKVTIIIPAYNAEDTIERAVLSLLNQTVKEIQIIIVNDGSEDRTRKIISKYEKDIEIIDIENSGVSTARNIGIEHAKAPYIMFLDADDYCAKEMIAACLQQQDRHNWDLLVFNYTSICDRIEKPMKNMPVSYCEPEAIKAHLFELMENQFNPIWNKVYKTDLLNRNHIRFCSDLTLGEDFNFNLEYILCASSVCWMPDPLYFYMEQADSLTTKFRDDYFEERLESFAYMNQTLMHAGMDNPLYHWLILKLVYGSIFNLYRKNCPYTKNQKISCIEHYCSQFMTRADYRQLTGVKGIMAKILVHLPPSVIYLLFRIFYGCNSMIPRKLRGFSV